MARVITTFILDVIFIVVKIATAWKVSKCGVFSRPYFPAFGLNTMRYGILGLNTMRYGILRGYYVQEYLKVWSLAKLIKMKVYLITV